MALLHNQLYIALITFMKKPSIPISLLFLRFVTVVFISLAVQVLIEIEIVLVSVTEILECAGVLLLARSEPMLTKKSLNLYKIPLKSVTILPFDNIPITELFAIEQLLSSNILLVIFQVSLIF